MQVVASTYLLSSSHILRKEVTAYVLSCPCVCLYTCVCFQTHNIWIIRVAALWRCGRCLVDCPLLSLHYQALMSHPYYPRSKQILWTEFDVDLCRDVCGAVGPHPGTLRDPRVIIDWHQGAINLRHYYKCGIVPLSSPAENWGFWMQHGAKEPISVRGILSG